MTMGSVRPSTVYTVPSPIVGGLFNTNKSIAYTVPISLHLHGG